MEYFLCVIVLCTLHCVHYIVLVLSKKYIVLKPLRLVSENSLIQKQKLFNI